MLSQDGFSILPAVFGMVLHKELSAEGLAPSPDGLHSKIVSNGIIDCSIMLYLC